MASPACSMLASRPPAPGRQQQPAQQQPRRRQPLQPLRRRRAPAPAALPAAAELLHPVLAALDIDWSDPDTQVGALGAVAGIVVGIGAPAFYISRDRRDEERLEELRALNRATKEATGEYLTREEIEQIRVPRWTDRREFQDDD